VVQRYRIHLEQRQYAPATINLRLAAVGRVAYEAADAGLLSPELAAGIRRVKGVRRLVVSLGNWLSHEEGRRLLEHDGPTTLRPVRDHAMLAMLIGCGLRRGELLGLAMESVQQREDHWVIVDLVGKGGHVRTVPIPSWVNPAVDAWTKAAGSTEGRVFRAINQGYRFIEPVTASHAGWICNCSVFCTALAICSWQVSYMMVSLALAVSPPTDPVGLMF
jgi:integrase